MHAAVARPAPVLGPYHARIEALLEENARLPRKQRYTSHRIFTILQEEGFAGGETTVRGYVARLKQAQQLPATFLPLRFDPGHDAQVDWGEATAIIGGVKQTVYLFVMRLCYSRRTFVMAFPSMKQESFFFGHVCAFDFFGGVPLRITYDNLATAVKVALDKPRTRREQRTFVSFRSHYLFDSHFCTPGQGHEKGQIEGAVGYVRRNYLVPIPEVASFDALNLLLLHRCRQEDGRKVSAQALSIGESWEEERSYLRPLPAFAYDCCIVTSARLTPYSQVIFETNRYSVPVNRARREVTVKAYPFHVDIVDGTTLLARHPRCFAREHDVFDPLHYLPLLEQRPGALEYATPMRVWRSSWPPSYHLALHQLRTLWPEGRGVQEFVRILQLHQHYPPTDIQHALEQAQAFGCVHLDGVLHCLQHLHDDAPVDPPVPLDVVPADLHAIGTQPIDLSRYDLLLKHLR